MTLPAHEGVESYTLLWDSALQVFPGEIAYRPGMLVPIAGASMQLFRALAPGDDPSIVNEVSAE